MVGNIVPNDMKSLLDSFNQGNLGKAQEFHRRLFVLGRDLLGLASNPIPIKAAMRMLGRDTGDVRLPLVPLEAEPTARLRDVLADYGLAVD